MNRVVEAAGRIRRLEVQGATEVAFEAIRAVVEQMKLSRASDRASALRELAEAVSILSGSRETEPCMRNSLRFLNWSVRCSDWRSLGELNESLGGTADRLLRVFSEALRKIGEIGSMRLSGGVRVLTHCHSSAVSRIFKESKARGNDFEVVCTETRPLFQGRRTARELLENGIKATMIVDSAVGYFMSDVDMVLVGCDAITSQGSVVNKVGTGLIALAARDAGVPFHVASELMKFDPETLHGAAEPIEERPSSEVWAEGPYGLVVRNPAFDVTRSALVDGLICEEGIVSLGSVVEAVRRSYPWIFEQSF